MMAYNEPMLARLAYIRERLDTSIWLIPMGLCVVSALLAAVMLWLDRRLVLAGLGEASLAMPLTSARQVLGVIAGSIISVGGVAFSVTMVALTLTSGQYGPRILRNFLDDSVNKFTLGLFLGTYVYTLIVMTGYAAKDTPRSTVGFALILAFLALAGFVRLIHRTATDLQADEIVQRIGGQLQAALQGLAEGDNPSERTCATLLWRRAARRHRPYPIAADRRGYVQTIDYPGLTRWSQDNECVLQVRVRAGDLVVEGACLFKVYGCDAKRIEKSLGDLRACVIVGRIRTPVQDPEYAITQLNQLAARALSPGINDPGTAITCIDWFSLALAQIVDLDIPGSVFLDQDQGPRLLARTSDFAGIVKAIYAPLRQFSRSEVSAAVGLVESLCRLARLTHREERLRILAMHGELIWNEIRKRGLSDYDLRDVRRRYLQLRSLIEPSVRSSG